MSHRSSGSARPLLSSPLANGADNVVLEVVAESLSPSDKGQPSEPKIQPVWITSETPPRPPRSPRRRRPQTAPHLSLSPSFDTRIDIHDLYPSISQIRDSSTDPSERESSVRALFPQSLPPEAVLDYSPIKHGGFLNRIPKSIQIDDDAASTSPSILLRRPSIPTLQSYIRSSTATSSNQSDQPSFNAAMRSQQSLTSTDASKPMVEVRTRAKSGVVISDGGSGRRRDRALDLDAEGKAAVLPPLIFTPRIRTSSEMSASPPVTASTLNNESTSSLTAYESPQEEESEVRLEEDLDAGKKLSWQMKDKTDVTVQNDVDEKKFDEPKPTHVLTLLSLGSTPELVGPGSPAKHHSGPSDKEATGGRDDKILAWIGGGKLVPRKAGVAVRRVWRTLIRRAA